MFYLLFFFWVDNEKYFTISCSQIVARIATANVANLWKLVKRERERYTHRVKEKGQSKRESGSVAKQFNWQQFCHLRLQSACENTTACIVARVCVCVGVCVGVCVPT